MPKFHVLSSEPKELKSFCPDTRPGGPVTGATGKSFMCKSFMCLFCSLNFPWKNQKKFTDELLQERSENLLTSASQKAPWNMGLSMQIPFVTLFGSETLTAAIVL